MRKVLLLLLCIFCVNVSNAQHKDDECYYFYGVDFSNTKVYAAGESVDDFVQAFEAINMLFILESEKYDFSKVFNKPVKVVVEPIVKKNSTIDYSGLKTLSVEEVDIDCPKIVSDYTLPQTEGIGAVFLAKLLDKSKNQAIFDIVLFDIENREILYQKEVAGKAGGFGLRNFWAGSIHRIIKSKKNRVLLSE